VLLKQSMYPSVPVWGAVRLNPRTSSFGWYAVIAA
jgi:hypothetical protein